jgi:hypothetical protein
MNSLPPPPSQIELMVVNPAVTGQGLLWAQHRGRSGGLASKRKRKLYFRKHKGMHWPTACAQPRTPARVRQTVPRDGVCRPPGLLHLLAVALCPRAVLTSMYHDGKRDNQYFSR